MTDRGYQYDFSASNEAMFDVAGRELKAATMTAVIGDYFSVPLGKLRLLDVGASTGIIDNCLANWFGEVTGIVIDKKAIEIATAKNNKSNIRFLVGDAMAVDSPNEAYDVVICAQVYEHVPDAHRMMREIFRVLIPGGICYFAASNRLMWNEPHYNLPLLSLLPRKLAHLYIQASGKANFYHELHFTYWGLKNLVNNFEIIDYTKSIIANPSKFNFERMLRPGSAKAKVASFIVSYLYWAMPGYIWLLKKPGEFVAQQGVAGDV